VNKNSPKNGFEIFFFNKLTSLKKIL
jgi:hypothetical protein